MRVLFFFGNLSLLAAPAFAQGISLAQIVQRIVPDSVQNYISGYQRADGFQINLALLGVDDNTLFTSAQNTWQSIITGDLTEVGGICASDNCGCIPCTVDDVHICGEYREIDGAGGVLGAAGPSRIRADNKLPVTGEMIFDTADVSAGSVDATVVLHEMAHVFGLGTLWTELGLADNDSPTCTYKTDSRATTEWRSISGCTSGSIPIENDGGTGTACGHWDDTCFKDELMTGFSSGANTLSRITIAGLEDLGYSVDYTNALSYGCTAMNTADSSCVCSCALRNLRGGINGAFRQIGVDEETHDKGQTMRERRRLSDAGQQEAIAYGMGILDSRKSERTGPAFNALSSDGEGAVYVGDKVVSVLYMEDNAIFSVLVVS